MPEKKGIAGAAAVMLILGFLATGSANTLTTKWADNLSAKDLNGNVIQFSHPFVQALGMFFGEAACYFVYLFDRWNTRRQGKTFSEATPGYHPLLFWGPALCDVFATSIMYFGLVFISSSVYQMMRGLVVLFVCLISKLVLKKSLPAFKWLGVFCILSGAAIVGIVAIIYTPSDGGSNQQAFGVSCVIIAVFIQAVQVTLEEKYLDAWKSVPAPAPALAGC
jgi:drug/metabolite transporter (DMT)-like permease